MTFGLHEATDHTNVHEAQARYQQSRSHHYIAGQSNGFTRARTRRWFSRLVICLLNRLHNCKSRGDEDNTLGRRAMVLTHLTEYKMQRSFKGNATITKTKMRQSETFSPGWSLSRVGMYASSRQAEHTRWRMELGIPRMVKLCRHIQLAIRDDFLDSS